MRLPPMARCAPTRASWASTIMPSCSSGRSMKRARLTSCCRRSRKAPSTSTPRVALTRWSNLGNGQWAMGSGVSMRIPLPAARSHWLRVLPFLVLAACSGDADASGRASSGDSTAAVAAADTTPSATQGQGDPSRPPNEMGKIMVVEYHLIGDKNALYERERNAFRQDLQTLYDRGYRPVTMSE